MWYGVLTLEQSDPLLVQEVFVRIGATLKDHCKSIILSSFAKVLQKVFPSDCPVCWHPSMAYLRYASVPGVNDQ